jgi:hypothetical protein
MRQSIQAKPLDFIPTEPEILSSSSVHKPLTRSFFSVASINDRLLKSRCPKLSRATSRITSFSLSLSISITKISAKLYYYSLFIGITQYIRGVAFSHPAFIIGFATIHSFRVPSRFDVRRTTFLLETCQQLLRQFGARPRRQRKSFDKYVFDGFVHKLLSD